MSNVVYLHGRPTPIERFLRVTEHRRLEQLLAADKLPYHRWSSERVSSDAERICSSPPRTKLRIGVGYQCRRIVCNREVRRACQRRTSVQC